MDKTNQRPAGLIVYIITLMLFLLCWGLGAWFYASMPESVPVHWGIDGQADRYGGRFEGAFGVPIVLTFMLAVFLLVSRMKGAQYIVKLMPLIALFLVAIQLIVGLSASGMIGDVTRLIVLCMAGLFIALGLLVPSFPQNRYGGFRNKYTMGDMRVWQSTNKLGGRMLILCGIIMIPLAFTPPMIAAIGISMVILICVVLIPLIQGLNMYRRIRAGS